MTETMKSEWLVFDEGLSCEKYNVYYTTEPVRIFGYEFVPDGPEPGQTDLPLWGKFTIAIDKRWSLEEMLSSIIEYLEWLADCKGTLAAYFGDELGQELPEGWYEQIEVYDASLTFLAPDDYGATISCGKFLLPDHVIECYFDGREIEENALIG